MNQTTLLEIKSLRQRILIEQNNIMKSKTAIKDGEKTILELHTIIDKLQEVK